MKDGCFRERLNEDSPIHLFVRTLVFIAGTFLAIGLGFFAATVYVQSICPVGGSCVGLAYPQIGLLVALVGIGMLIVARFVRRPKVKSHQTSAK